MFDLVPRDRCIYADLQNYGNMPALDIRVTLQPELYSIGEKRTSTLLNNSIGMLAPGRVISDLIDAGHQFHKKNALKFTGTVLYKDTRGNEYHEDFPLDLKYYVEKLETDRKDIGCEIEKLKDELLKINRTLASFQADGKGS